MEKFQLSELEVILISHEEEVNLWGWSADNGEPIRDVAYELLRRYKIALDQINGVR